jgi:hypothetical protein
VTKLCLGMPGMRVGKRRKCVIYKYPYSLRLTENPRVVGSIPTLATISFSSYESDITHRAEVGQRFSIAMSRLASNHP